MKFEPLAHKILELKKSSNSKRTLAVSRSNFRRLISFFGEMNLIDINEFSWNVYVLKCKTDTPNRRLIHDRKHMVSVMGYAFREGLIPRQIFFKIPDVSQEVGREITGPELKRLIKHASKELNFQIQIAFRMGLRLREMLSLKWNRINWVAKTIKLRPEDTKTRRGREFPIPKTLFSRFRSRYRKSDSIFVFPSPSNPAKPQYENRTAWERCRRLASVSARWHDLRHTCASILLRLGITSSVVARYLGMGEKVLLRIYQHIHMDELWKAADAMNNYR